MRSFSAKRIKRFRLSADSAPVLEKIKAMISTEKRIQPHSDGPVKV